ncbi:MAG: hypothetical protein AAF409_21735 [Pseudomonadota bacterium]
MPLQNRMTPFGEVVVAPWRGALMGNRGCIHDADGRLGVRRWRHQNWVCCVTSFRERHRHPMPPGRWTALFFWDEAAALAAGHRPCGECRYQDYKRFMAAWEQTGLPGGPGRGGPRLVDRTLHRARVTRRREQVRFKARSETLPDGCFVVVPEGEHMPMLLWAGRLHHLSLADGRYYDAGLPPEEVTVLTPAPIVQVLGEGYAPATRLACNVKSGP